MQSLKDIVSPGLTMRPFSAAAEISMLLLRSLSLVVVVVNEEIRPNCPTSWLFVIVGSTCSPFGTITRSYAPSSSAADILLKRRSVHAVAGFRLRKRKCARLHVKRRKGRIRRVVFKAVGDDLHQPVDRRSIIGKARL